MCKLKTRALGLLEECVAEIGIAKEISAGIKQPSDFPVLAQKCGLMLHDVNEGKHDALFKSLK